MDRSAIAYQYHKEGWNCAQSVAGACASLAGRTPEEVMPLLGGFGGGIGGSHEEVCGAVSGMFLVAGMLYGYGDPKDFQGKKEHYGRVQQLAKAYEEENGSIVCRELLGLAKKKDVPTPEQRTEEYYKKRPCGKLVRIAAAIMEQYIEGHPLDTAEENKI